MLFKASDETLRIKEYLEQKNPGDIVTYDEIGAETGVNMNSKGKSRLRSALKSLGLDFDTIRGQAIVLASAQNGLGIVGGKMQRISSAINKSRETHRRIQERFLAEMTQEEQKRMVYIGATFAIIHEYSQQLKPKGDRQAVYNAIKPVLPAG